MQLGLNGSTVLITGAASGIGRACALAFALEGAKVGAIDRNATGLEALSAELAAQKAVSCFAVADVADQVALSEAVSRIASELGGIDVVVGSAGISGPMGKPIEQVSYEEWNSVFAVNVTGQFLLVTSALQFLRASSSPSVILVASDSAFVAAPGMVPYCASKGAVLQFTKALSVELAGDGIRVNCVCPSIVDTPMSRADLGVGPLGFSATSYPVQSASDVASHVLYLGSAVSRPINGAAIVSDFGYSARSAFPA